MPSYHSTKENTVWRKCCKVCCSEDAQALSHLPFFQPIIEDEQHVLGTCPKYHHLRMQLEDDIKSLIISWDTKELPKLFNETNVLKFSRFVRKIFKIRFPNEDTEGKEKAANGT